MKSARPAQRSGRADRIRRHAKDRSAGFIVFHRTENSCRFLLLLSLVTRRPLWEFPKGGLAAGESLLEAALRELEEETGLAGPDVRVIDGFQRVERYRFVVEEEGARVAVHKRVTYFLAEAAHDRVRLSSAEASRHVWAELGDALRRVRYAVRREMLREAARLGGCTE